MKHVQIVLMMITMAAMAIMISLMRSFDLVEKEYRLCFCSNSIFYPKRCLARITNIICQVTIKEKRKYEGRWCFRFDIDQNAAAPTSKQLTKWVKEEKKFCEGHTTRVRRPWWKIKSLSAWNFVIFFSWEKQASVLDGRAASTTSTAA